MGSLMGLMSLTESALNADQSAIDITSNNVANQNTPGYTAQVAQFQSSDAVSLSGFQGAGEAVSVTAVSQRSRVLEQQLQQQTQGSSASTARLTSLQDLQSLFGLSSTSTNASSTVIGSALDSFFSSLTALSANPTDAATQSSAVAAAGTLASAFNATAQGLNSEVTGLNSQIATAAEQVNGLTATVAKLNGQITELSPNADAGSLEDARQQAILQLSSLLGVSQITTESNGVTLTTSSGAVLVSGSESFSLSTTNVGGNTAIVAGAPPAVQQSVQGGTIGGLMQVRDQDIPTMQSAMDELAYAVGTAVNQQNEAGTTSNGSGGSAIFSLTASAGGAAGGISVVSGANIAAAGAGEGASGTSNALALAGLATSSIVGGETASGMFAAFVGSVGDTVSSATTASTADAAALTQAQTQRDSLSGVSLDDEASQLTEYQRAYQAAAQVFSIVDELLANTINLGQQTAVS